jgi:DNA-directed RNA polymerase subunit H (RpoH/RPB5)
MPYGKYTVCYQSGTKDSVASITNQGTGEIVKIYNGSLTTGSCAT